MVLLGYISMHDKVPQRFLNKLGITKYEMQNKDILYYKLKVLHSLYFDKKNYEIIMLGDSITAGGEWEQLLQGYDVANYGIPGDTTDGILLRLQEIYLANPKKVFIMVGTNDLYFSGRNDDDNYTVMTIYNNYQRIVNSLRENGIEVIIQSTLNVLSETSGRKNNDINTLNKLLQNFCVKENLIFLDINSVLVKDGLLQKQFTTDGLHINRKGYEKWKEIIIKELENH
jgi:lysophospholipase L1-like esterase